MASCCVTALWFKGWSAASGAGQSPVLDVLGACRTLALDDRNQESTAIGVGADDKIATPRAEAIPLGRSQNAGLDCVLAVLRMNHYARS